MKKRFRLLIGLGIVFVLSVSVPVFATTSSDSQSMESDSSAKSSDSHATESGSSGESSGSQNTESGSSGEITEPIINNITATWQQEETAEGHIGDWYLSLTDTSINPATISTFKGNGAYKVGEKTYYFSEGYLLNGFVTIEAVPDTEVVETDIVPNKALEIGKTYYFNIEGSDPSKDNFGSLVTGEDQWLIFSYKNGELPDEWYYLTADGEIDLTMIGIQQISDEQWIYIKEDHTLGDWESGWYLIDDTAWYYLNEDGTRDNTKVGYVEIDGNYYYLNEDGTAKTGVVEVNGKKYYFIKNDGGKQAIAIGWQLLDGELLYFNSASEIANSGHNGWLYQYDHWYYFQKGTMKTGWQKVKNTWYYMNADGKMATGWTLVGNTWYYLNSSGAMQTGWLRLGNTWYYLNTNGAMITGWVRTHSGWYYLNHSGAMQTGWYNVGQKRYYSNANGTMQSGWLKDGANWYYLGASNDGSMKTGWYKVGSVWYYSDADGKMLTGWQFIENCWYYCYSTGAMAANRWVGDYYLLSNGQMATNQWIGKYWVGEDGKWIPNYDPDVFGGKWVPINSTWYYQRADGSYVSNQWKKIKSEWYYFKSNGAMVTGWQYINGYKYYFASSGKLMQDLDGILAKQSTYEITINRKKCQVMVYAYDSTTEKYCIPVKTFACSVGLPDTPTPTGTFYTSQKLRWHELMGPSYGQYCTRITGSILFHSVASPYPNNNNLPASEYNKLGSPASHGCVRLCVRDAKWIHDNCRVVEYDKNGKQIYKGTKVTINDTAYTPFDKPATIKIPASYTWDPTDPEPPAKEELP